MWPRWKESEARNCSCAGTASEAKPTQNIAHPVFSPDGSALGYAVRGAGGSCQRSVVT